jgi:hypothetical protein
MTGLEDSFECDYSVSTAPTCQRPHHADNDDDGDADDDVNSDITCNVVIDELVVEVDSDIAVDEDDEVSDAEDYNEGDEDNNRSIHNSPENVTEISVEELDDLDTGFADDITDSVVQLDALACSRTDIEGPRAGSAYLDVDVSSDGSNYDSRDESLGNDTQNNYPQGEVNEPESINNYNPNSEVPLQVTSQSFLTNTIADDVAKEEDEDKDKDAAAVDLFTDEKSEIAVERQLLLPVPDVAGLVRSVLRRKSLNENLSKQQQQQQPWSQQQRQRRFVDTETDRVSKIMLSKLT